MARARMTTVIGSLVPLALCTIAFAFAIKTLTSRDWAIRRQYDTAFLEEQWNEPGALIGTISRSPFVVCGTRAAESGDGTVFQCVSYPAPGTNSCLPLSEARIGNDTSIPLNYGDERLCQQIHWAGNLAIASTVFIGLGFLVTLGMSMMATLALLSPAIIRAEECSDHGTDGNEPKSDAQVAVREQSRLEPHRKQRYLSPAAPYMNAFLVIILIMGAIMYVLAQFYGVLAFVQSAPDNAAFASSGTSAQNRDHGPWIQGKALSVYASVAWLASILTALWAGWVWRLPTGQRSPL